MSGRLVAAALALAAAAGCARSLDVAGVAWTRPDTDRARTTADEMECVRVASDAGRTPDAVVGGLADLARNEIRERVRARVYDWCMAGKGYRRPPG